MDNSGYLKLYRSMRKWEWYKDTNTKIVFLHLLLNANWEPSRYMGYEIPKGGLVVGLKSLSRELKISIQSIRTALEHLKSTNEITIKSTNKFSIVTIVNWEKYQGYDDEVTNKTTSKPTNDQQTTNKQLTTEEEYKNKRTKEEYKLSSLRSDNMSVTPDYEEVMKLWNELDGLGNIKGIKSIGQGSKRYDNVRARLKTFGIDGFKEAISNIKKSSFLQGNNAKGWTVTFDWFVLPSNFPKVLEGNYNDKTEKEDWFDL